MTNFPTSLTDLSSDQKILLSMRGLAFAKAKSAIQLLTLTKDADAIFKLRDDDWVKICDLKIENRTLFEHVIKEGWQHFETLWSES